MGCEEVLATMSARAAVVSGQHGGEWLLVHAHSGGVSSPQCPTGFPGEWTRRRPQASIADGGARAATPAETNAGAMQKGAINDPGVRRRGPGATRRRATPGALTRVVVPRAPSPAPA